MTRELLKKRLGKNREMTTITVRMPVDVVESLKAIAPQKGLSGYQALLKSYVSAGLRKDEAEFVYGPAQRLVEGLRKRGVDPRLIEEVMHEVQSADQVTTS